MKHIKASELLTSNDKMRSDEDAIKKLAKLVWQMSLDFAEVSEWGRRFDVLLAETPPTPRTSARHQKQRLGLDYIAWVVLVSSSFKVLLCNRNSTE